MKRSEFLMDVVVIRLLLIFLLVFCHAFSIFSGGWDIPYDGFPNIPLYSWFAKIVHGFRLEAMVFISGLLLGYVTKKYPERLSFNGCVTKKVKRVLLPSVLFSIAYYFIFFDKSAPWYVITYRIVDGCGHMWFLPMIFWCFVLTYLIAKFTPPLLQARYILCASAVMLLFAIPIPFGVGYMMSFFFFFYLGFAIKRGLLNIKMMQSKGIIILSLFYVVLVVARNEVKMIPRDTLTEKVLLNLVMRTLHMVGATCMVFALFSLANIKRIQAKIGRSDILITMSGYCYGVYIYHQFVLKYLYFKTSFPLHFSPELLPWLGLLIGLVLSLFFCYLTLKTRFGRYLIG